MNYLAVATRLLGGLSLGCATIVVAASGPSSPFPVGLQFAQVTMRDQVIIRIQTLTPRAAPTPLTNRLTQDSKTRWKERKAPKCVVIRQLAGAAVTQADSIDLVMRGGSRLRAKLESNCPAIDFYNGFYLKPTEDGKICAGRDIIHSRSGGQCEINTFRTLVPNP